MMLNYPHLFIKLWTVWEIYAIKITCSTAFSVAVKGNSRLRPMIFQVFVLQFFSEAIRESIQQILCNAYNRSNQLREQRRICLFVYLLP